MAKCDICGRGAFFGNQVSHSHRRSNKVWHANVQRSSVHKASSKAYERTLRCAPNHTALLHLSKPENADISCYF